MRQHKSAGRAWKLSRCAVVLAALVIPAGIRYATAEDRANNGGVVQTSGEQHTEFGDASGAAMHRLAIEPMTTIGRDHHGYFEDPYPVRLAPSRGDRAAVFSGTTQAIMSCQYPLAPTCFSWTKATIDAGSLEAQITAAHDTITNFQNLNVFQDDAGGWHAVLAIGVCPMSQPSHCTGSAQGEHWTVLVHAHPLTAATPDATPLAWSADILLSGSLSKRVDGNYDGKYFEDRGRLYLLYVKNYVPKPDLRNEVVLQPMVSPTQVAPVEPTILLSPGDRYGALESEWYDHTKAKLVEAPYIIEAGGKYALIYSAGAFQQVDYKAGVAWSDTLLPAHNGRYRKVLEPDKSGIWGPSRHPEVRYLLQSQHSDWPNYTADQVISPGVASAVQGLGGTWWLCFAGFDPADRPLQSPGVANAHHRRPFMVKLRVAVPENRTVTAASDEELASWLQPEVQ